MNGASPDPHPIRLWPTLAGAAVAIGAGSLLSGGVCARGPAVPGVRLHPLAFVAAQWLFAAACMFAGNQLWVGRDRRERAEMLVVCLGMAIPVMPALWIGSYMAFAAFGATWQ